MAIATEIKQSKQQPKSGVFKPQHIPKVCDPIKRGYEFEQGVDSPRNDIGHMKYVACNLIDKCQKDDKCMGFNTSGYYKSNVTNMQKQQSFSSFNSLPPCIFALSISSLSKLGQVKKSLNNFVPGWVLQTTWQ